MTALIRTALASARTRRAARHVAGVGFCDTCAQVCDASCRATAHQRRTRSALFIAH